MAEKTEDTVYSTKTLSKYFAIASMALLIVTVWAVIEDYDREWKSYMRQSHLITATVTQMKLLKVQKDTDEKALADVQAKLAAVKKEREDVVKEIDDRISSLDAVYYRENQIFQFEKGKLDAMLYQLDHAVADQKPYSRKMKAEYNALSEKVASLKRVADAAERELNAAKDKKADILADQKKLEDELFRLTNEADRLEKTVFLNDANLANLIRNAPLVDFVAPTVKIQQVVLPHLKDNYFFNKVPRVDRCMTCHAFADKKGYEDMPHPFRTHPKIDLMVGADSVHPVEKIGCTVCHGGVPQSVDFSLSAHTPKDEAAEVEWLEKYDYHRSSHIKTHMVPVAMTEGKCLQCHATEIHLDGAPTFNAGMQAIEKLGCWGCHKFAGSYFEELANSGKKVGPPLLTLASKLDKEWVTKWIWEPRSFRPTTLMPQYWKQHNNSDPESLKRGAVEVTAITEYLFSKSKPYEPFKLASQAVGDATRGKEIVGSVGCLGCHAVDDFPSDPITDVTAVGYTDPRIPMFGPELNQMGSKVDEEWLKAWLKNPKHYWEQTSMPSMKLSDQEVVDLSAYLLSKRNERFEFAPSPMAEVGVSETELEKRVGEMVTYYYEQTMSPDDASVKLASMSLQEQKVYLGQRLIGHYGCYGCHAIEGFEDAPMIGAELTYEGSKDVTKFDFGNVKISHVSREEWIYTKIRTPRVWDVGKAKDFEGKTRMPNYYLNHDTATAVAAIVIGHEEKNVDDEAIRKVDGRLEAIVAGQKVVSQNNCVGCHAIQKDGGRILEHYSSDPTMGPPNLNTEGAKLQPDWFRAYLSNPSVTIRPKLKVRMPQFYFDQSEIEAVVHYFAAYDGAEYPVLGAQYNKLTSDEFRQAQEIVQKHACLTCHAVVPPGGDLSASAPHFAEVRHRLRGTWIPAWLEDPQAIMPGTAMPTLWPLLDEEDPSKGRIALPGYFGDDASVQMQKVRDYLFMLQDKPNLPQAREPTKADTQVEDFKLKAR
jgi:cytochrome c2